MTGDFAITVGDNMPETTALLVRDGENPRKMTAKVRLRW